ncbi:hypothetical protein BDY21DRAFT_356535 [Lineolata rhizophorae]|uniref:Uncharacterized protein n=1 Tax=Lineolata rhizophorae TaxID=578093 RepID=A0A6A6NPZ2_9PEZI|nr:hypothetical protein BDY21DRAFT_356535 [Lineolata rhizophorae]
MIDEEANKLTDDIEVQASVCRSDLSRLSLAHGALRAEIHPIVWAQRHYPRLPVSELIHRLEVMITELMIATDITYALVGRLRKRGQTPLPVPSKWARSLEETSIWFAIGDTHQYATCVPHRPDGMYLRSGLNEHARPLEIDDDDDWETIEESEPGELSQVDEHPSIHNVRYMSSSMLSG